MAWCRTGGKALSEPLMLSFLTHICVTRRPQWGMILYIPRRNSIYSYLGHINASITIQTTKCLCNNPRKLTTSITIGCIFKVWKRRTCMRCLSDQSNLGDTLHTLADLGAIVRVMSWCQTDPKQCYITITGFLGTKHNAIEIKTHTYSRSKMLLKMFVTICRPFCTGLEALIKVCVLYVFNHSGNLSESDGGEFQFFIKFLMAKWFASVP